MERLSLTKEEQLEEFIREGKLKPALKLVDSKQKKGDRSDALLIRKIIILFKFEDEGHKQQGIKELEGLRLKRPHITDHQALRKLDDFLCGSKDRDDYTDSLWAVAGAASKDEEFLRTWLNLKFDQERWEAAQKAAQTWQKAFPRNRTPFFLWILSLHIASIQPDIQENPRKLAQGLSHRLLAKAAAEVPVRRDPKETGSPSPPRALASEEDLCLLLDVYIAQRKYADALAILEDPRTGFLSHLCRDKRRLAMYMIGLYELAGDWKGQWNLCSAILVHARPKIFKKVDDESAIYDFGEAGDDWRVWDGLVTSCGKLSDGPDATTYINRTETIIEQSSHDRASRNAILANLKMHSIRSPMEHRDQERLLSLCKFYFDEFGSKAICFQDLRPYVSYLLRDNQKLLLRHMGSYASQIDPSPSADTEAWSRWMIVRTNFLKFEYHLVSSLDDDVSLESFLPAFVGECLRHYNRCYPIALRLPQSDREPSDDAAILAAMALLHMYRLKETNPTWSYSLHRSIALLEFALRKSQHNYDILLILVRLYLHMGAGSLAVARYQQLSIKNIQNMTLPWMLFTRLSTLHPHPMTVDRDDGTRITLDPLEEATKIRHWYLRACDLNGSAMEDFAANNQWGMKLDALEVKYALHHSFDRLLMYAESSRMCRFRHVKDASQGNGPQILRLSTRIKDARDLTAFPNYEADGQPTFWEICQSLDGSPPTRPNERWLGLNLRQAVLWDHLSDKHNTVVRNDELASFLEHYEGQSTTLSNAENNLVGICDFILRGCRQLDPRASEGGSLADSVGQILLALNTLNDRWSQAIKPDDDPIGMPQDAALHAGYCSLEICQFVAKFAAVLQRSNRLEVWVSKMLVDLEAECKKLAASISERAIEERDVIKNKTVPDKILKSCTENDDVGEAFNQLVDSKHWENIIKMLCKSWQDALEGLMKTAATV